MIIIESIPLFMTVAPPSVVVAAARKPAQRPPLPPALWLMGLATFAEARQAQRRLSGDYQTRCGKGDAGYYVAGPDSGLCAVVPCSDDTGADEFELTFEGQ